MTQNRMVDHEENEGMALDLSLNLSPAPPVVMDLALELGSGLGSTPVPNNDEISIGEGSIRERVCRGIELRNHNRGFQDRQRSVQEALNEEDEVMHELFGQPEQDERYRSNQVRHRWRRHVRARTRIRPTILDSNPSPISLSRRSESSVSPLFVFRSVHTNGSGMGTVVDEPNIDSNATDNSNSERPVEIHKQNFNRPLNNDNININSSEAVQEADERSNGVSNFECNICLETAREPVVTSCGHLFCWACLYRWLHVHSNSKECPVCKGEVTEINITPIYGRGKCNVDSAAENERKVGEEQGEKIPPRPRAHRIEGLRQRMRIGRPVSRRLAEAIRLWQESRAQHENRGAAGGDGDGHGDRREAAPRDDGVENLLGVAADQILNRLRAAHRLQREGLEDGWQMQRRRNLLRVESRSNTNAPPNVTATSSHLAVEDRIRGRGEDNWEGRQEIVGGFQRSIRAGSERFVSMRARISSVEVMIDTLAARSRTNMNSANVTPPIGEPRAQRPPALALAAGSEPRTLNSSTNAIIIGDSMLEEESVRSPSPQRINGASVSLDVDADGGSPHPRKRRRLN